MKKWHGPGRDWQKALWIEEGDRQPLFVRVAQAIIDGVRIGRFRPGERLPGSRTLAKAVAVHRNTVVAAYAELVAEGWIRASESEGTFVAETLPIVKGRRLSILRPTGIAATPGFPLAKVSQVASVNEHRKGTLSLTALPDARLMPVGLLARAYRRVLRSRRDSVLGYGRPNGHPRLREALAHMLRSTRGLPATADDVLVTQGGQMGIFLAARCLFKAGDVVAVEALGYRKFWDAMKVNGARLLPIPVDREGMDVSALEKVVLQMGMRAVYVTPHHQFPSTVTLSAPRRLALLELARRHRFAVIEDDYDHDFHYDSRPLLPLASADRAGVVIYIGSMAKTLAPGLRLGYVVAARMLLEEMTAQRSLVDSHGDLALECAVAELLEDGDVQRLNRRARRIYHARRDALASVLDRELKGVLSFDVPRGGMALWAKLEDSRCTSGLKARALKQGVSIQEGREFAFDSGAIPWMRLGFSALDDKEMREAVRRLKKAFHGAP